MILLMAAAAVQTVFGLTLGQPVSIPDCKKGPPVYGVSSSLSDQPNLCKDITTEKYGNHFSDFIRFPLAEVPKISSSSIMGVWIENNMLWGVEFDTSGFEDQDLVISSLSDKYGKPTSIVSLPMQTINGVKYVGKDAEWKLSGVFIRIYGIYGEVTHGRVQIMLPEAETVLEGEKAAADRKRTEL